MTSSEEVDIIRRLPALTAESGLSFGFSTAAALLSSLPIEGGRRALRADPPLPTAVTVAMY